MREKVASLLAEASAKERRPDEGAAVPINPDSPLTLTLRERGSCKTLAED